ncbi:MAG: LysR family transcriptional regulator [Pseudomonadota bacterium]
MNWSDIPYVLAVCRTGSLSGAARRLGVNHSTVFRRIEALEKNLGVKLFERLPEGYVLTSAGEHFYRRAITIENGVDTLNRELGGKDLRLEGRLAVTTTDSLLYRLTPVFLKFQEQYKEIDLRLISETRALNLNHRDADIALRPTQNPPEQWVGRKLFPIICATYAHRDYLADVQNQAEETRRWIGLSEDLNRSPMHQVQNLIKPKTAPVTVVNTMMGVFEMIRSGLGIGAMPCYLGEHCEELVRVHEPMEQFSSHLWILAHPDMHRSARVHAFFKFATQLITEDYMHAKSG